ncbi:MAG: sulfatase-like hydrolase/transferase, partial [Verrucomicrobiota bacterium]
LPSRVGPRSASAAAPRPDILLLMPDQFRGDCLSAVGHPVVKTPTLDALAAEGALFRRAYSTTPSCIPARHALLTGQFPQTSGVVGYALRPLRAPTLPALLVKAGYAAVLVGRNMHQSPESGLLGYERQFLGSTYISGDVYDEELKAKVPESGGIRAIINQLQVDTNRWPAKAWPLAEELHPTNWVVRKSREIVAETPAAQPLFLTASFYAPHPPLFPPERLFEKYLKADLPPVAMGAWVEKEKLKPEGDKSGQRVLLEGDMLRRAQAGYFGLIEHLDEQLALLIADFKARSVRAGRPWAIVVTTDHGEMLGDHGYFRKCEPYEGSANIPLLFAGARELGFARGVRSHAPVGLEDILPTLLALAGAKPPEKVDGRDLAPVLRGDKSARVRDWLHFEHSPIYSPDQGFQALTDGRWKYIWRTNSGREQLFDLEADPREQNDLSASADHRATLEKWRGTMIERLKARPEGFVQDGKLVAGRKYVALHPLPKS